VKQDTFAGETIAYVDIGTGPSVLLLHSLGGGAWVWNSLIERLSPTYRCIAPDLPGHGSSSYRQPFTIEGAATSIAQLVDSLDAAPAAVIGVSLGGHVAIQMHEQGPQRLGAMVLANHSLGGRPQARTMIEGLLARRRAMPEQDYAREYVASRFSPEVSADLLTRYEQSVLAMAPGAYETAFTALATMDARAAAARISRPALVVASSADVSSPADSVRQMHLTIPDSTYALIEGANHFAYLQSPDSFNELVLAHFAAHPW